MNGTYTCTCRKGFRSDGPGKPCVGKSWYLGLTHPSPSLSVPHLHFSLSLLSISLPSSSFLPLPPSPLLVTFLSLSISLPWFPCFVRRTYVRLPLYLECPVSDYNECRQPGLCQYQCINREGGYQCVCPPGYQLHMGGRACLDIDECSQLNIACGPEQKCFNMRGGFECVDTTCPTDYERLKSGWVCDK